MPARTLTCLARARRWQTVMRYQDYCKDQSYIDSVFRRFDGDGNDLLAAEEVLRLLQAVAPEDCVADMADVEYIVSEADKDGDGQISREELVRVLSTMHAA